MSSRQVRIKTKGLQAPLFLPLSHRSKDEKTRNPCISNQDLLVGDILYIHYPKFAYLSTPNKLA